MVSCEMLYSDTIDLSFTGCPFSSSGPSSSLNVRVTLLVMFCEIVIVRVAVLSNDRRTRDRVFWRLFVLVGSMLRDGVRVGSFVIVRVIDRRITVRVGVRVIVSSTLRV